MSNDTATTKSPARIEFLTDVLITAVEGGYTGMWGHLEDYRWSPEDPAERGVTVGIAAEGGDSVERTDITVPEVGYGVLELGWPHPEGTEVPVYVVRVDLDAIARGVGVVTRCEAGVASDYVGRIFTASLENDCGLLDAIDADIILQAGIFGKTIFG